MACRSYSEWIIIILNGSKWLGSLSTGPNVFIMTILFNYAIKTELTTTMKFHELRNYITNEMKMQHIYQPIMLKKLLKEKEHRATIFDIAREFLINDEPQLQYYKYITKVMPGKVLSNHNIVRREGDDYVLNIAAALPRDKILELISLCDAKIDEYEIKYGKKSIWHSRFAGAKDISGPMQYEVLKRAKGRCELCAVPRDVKALQVDHIIPRSKGGLTVLENLQALCYTCNAQKQNKDDTDVRGLSKLYDVRVMHASFAARKKRRQ